MSESKSLKMLVVRTTTFEAERARNVWKSKVVDEFYVASFKEVAGAKTPSSARFEASEVTTSTPRWKVEGVGEQRTGVKYPFYVKCPKCEQKHEVTDNCGGSEKVHLPQHGV